MFIGRQLKHSPGTGFCIPEQLLLKMRFFSRLFNRRKSESIRKPDLEKLLAAQDINSSILELDNYISELSSWGEDLENLTKPQRNFYLNQNLEREVNHGGFRQYFYNSTGEYAHETIVSLRSIGALATAKLLQEAMLVFPESRVPKNIMERQQLVADLISKNAYLWSEMDQTFLGYEEDLNVLNIEYVRKFREMF